MSTSPLLSFAPEIASEDQALLASSFLLQNWLHQVQKHFDLSSLYLQSVDWVVRGQQKQPLFIKLRAEACRRSDGQKVPGVVLLRGSAVGVLVVFLCDDQRYVLLVDQARFPIGEPHHLESVAGILDWSSDPREVAVRELEEEGQIVAEPSELVDLMEAWHGPGVDCYAASCGLLDERIHLYLLERRVTAEELAVMNGRHQAYTDENEGIRTWVLSWEDAEKRITDSKTQLAMSYYQKLRKQLFA